VRRLRESHLTVEDKREEEGGGGGGTRSSCAMSPGLGNAAARRGTEVAEGVSSAARPTPASPALLERRSPPTRARDADAATFAPAPRTERAKYRSAAAPCLLRPTKKTHHSETYEYYKLPFCKPKDGVKWKTLGVGEVRAKEREKKVAAAPYHRFAPSPSPHSRRTKHSC